MKLVLTVLSLLAFLLVAAGLVARITDLPYGNLFLVLGIGVSVIWFILVLFFKPTEKEHFPDVLDQDVDS